MDLIGTVLLFILMGHCVKFIHIQYALYLVHRKEGLLKIDSARWQPGIGARPVLLSVLIYETILRVLLCCEYIYSFMNGQYVVL